MDYIDLSGAHLGMDPVVHARAAILALAALEGDDATLCGVSKGLDPNVAVAALATMLVGYMVEEHGVDGAVQMLNELISGCSAAALG